MNSVVIVFPVYRKLNYVFEQIAVSQFTHVLKKYPICLVGPESFCFNDVIKELGPGVAVETFRDDDFSSVEAYSRLCLDKTFYERFRKYDYMLICQQDAFVFSDRLQEFVDLGYDYIGAPLHSFLWKEYHVGNGGLSLRRVSKAIEMLEHFEEYTTENERSKFYHYEDLFWGYCGYRNDIDFSVPDIETAASFSVQDDSCDAFKRIEKNGLPFGTHRWGEEDYSYWKPIIESYGYRLPEVGTVRSNECRKREVEKRMLCISVWKIRNAPEGVRDRYLSDCGLCASEEYFIWGNGRYGERCRRLFRGLGIHIVGIIDNAADSMSSDAEIPLLLPGDCDLKEKNVVIAVKGKEKEISEQIKALSDTAGTILSFEKIVDKLIERTGTDYPQLRKMAENLFREELEEKGISMEYYW